MNEMQLIDTKLDAGSIQEECLPSPQDDAFEARILAASRLIESEFTCLSISVPGLKPITSYRAIQSMIDPNSFGLDLEREKGGSFLSSQIHSDLRKGFFNSLDQEFRIKVIEQKFLALGLTDALGWRDTDILNVTDIGGERAVYKIDLDLDGGTRSVVVKREVGDKQSWYAKLVNQLGMPSYESKHFKLTSGEYEITEWLPGRTLSKFFIDLKNLTQEDRVSALDSMLPRLARLAALNDIIGLGDHHHDNKIVGPDGEIRQIDISRWVFDKDNDTWTSKYIAGGWYEPSIILFYQPELQELTLQKFFDYYKSAIKEFAEVRNVFHTEGDPAFVDRALLNPDGFSEQMKALYSAAIPEMRRRAEMKEMLQALAATLTGSALLQSPEYSLLRMYQLADYNRPSAFYLIEDKAPQQIVAQLSELKAKVLAASTI